MSSDERLDQLIAELERAYPGTPQWSELLAEAFTAAVEELRVIARNFTAAQEIDRNDGAPAEERVERALGIQLRTPEAAVDVLGELYNDADHIGGLRHFTLGGRACALALVSAAVGAEEDGSDFTGLAGGMIGALLREWDGREVYDVVAELAEEDRALGEKIRQRIRARGELA